MPPDSTVTDLADRIQDDLQIPVDKQKFMIAKLGMLKPPFGDRPVTDLADRKITLLGTSSDEMASLRSASEGAAARQARQDSAARRVAPRAHARRDQRRAEEESRYTFQVIRPLAHLPGPERSRAFLERLAADPGIRAAMRAHRFSVGLLTEMDPAAYTESGPEGTTRILGLNRNRGEVVELRLRTDAYDGYRDYKTIRNTLCHELAHNVHGPHDRHFWDLCHQIEREVAAADWKSGGRAVGDAEFYEPSEEIAYDHGGWTGGEFVLGGGGGGGGGSGGGGSGGGGDMSGSSARSADSGSTLSRREIMAKAAEERVKREKQTQADPSGGDAPAPESS
ncbi:putative WLM domain-containing protein [Rosellinia necatrix]|uniref:Putative WLM domain-containing protein n=1 Tax=Rosellinia necatrix TaxID=77044 RepID=A0A1S7UKJ8_ROSNE|nr:putative WLM domain-containing protein [Rosellinia necatrix]